MTGGISPFLKWAGGKRWLFTPDWVRDLPPHSRYIEPFLGGAAGFFAITPKKALLSDTNADLIEVYRVIRDEPLALARCLKGHQAAHAPQYYYEVRGRDESSAVKRAARFLYLNRTCWNGLYRLNKKGEFNVPIGTKSAIFMGDDEFLPYAKALKNATIVACDFEKSIDRARKGDLLFLDPPYTVKHNMNGFVKYNESIFSWDDQVRLRDAAQRAVARGARLIVTNADHSSVRELYDGLGSQSSIERTSVISGKSAGRSKITELMVVA